MSYKVWVLAALLGLGSCQSQVAVQAPPVRPPPSVEETPRLILKPATFADLPGWRQDRWAQALPALLRSCDRIMNLPQDSAVGSDGAAGTVRDWLGPCGAARKVRADDDESARQFFESWFVPWLSTDNNKPDGLFTGYYEPEVKGSKRRHDAFTVPLYARPSDLISVDLAKLRPDLAKQLGNEVLAGRIVAGRLEPYANRMDIETNGLGDKAQALFWLDDPVAAHILHIQGSGRVRLEDGSLVRVAVAATNGHRFVGLGRILADHGKVEAGATMPQIREWLTAHPAEAMSFTDRSMAKDRSDRKGWR